LLTNTADYLWDVDLGAFVAGDDHGFEVVGMDKDFSADEPVSSRTSFRILFTWFLNVCHSVLPGIGTSLSLCAF
jgi:hypothetical protein